MSDRYRSYRCIGRDRQLKADNKYLQLESESLTSYIAGHESSSSYNETLEDLVTHNFCTQDKTQKMTNVQRYEYKRQCLKKNVLKTQSLIQSVTADYDEILSLEKAKTRQLQCEVSKLHSELECLGEKLQSITSTNTILKTQVTEKEGEVNAHIKEIETELKKTETERDLAFRVKAELEVQAKSDENRIRSLEKKMKKHGIIGNYMIMEED